MKQTVNLCTHINNRIEFFQTPKELHHLQGIYRRANRIHVLSILCNKRSYRLLKHLSTVPTKPVSKTEEDYQRHVTPYAFLQIQEQLKYSLVTVVNENTVET